MKRIFYASSIRNFTLALLLFLVGSQIALGEGSKDFWEYPGFRLFYLIAPTNNISNEQQTKVYAAEGEFINVGASHVGIVGGFIQVYRPDGTLHSVFDGSNGTAIINNNVEELAGPTGGGTTNGTGYIPGVIQVQAGEAGIWTVILDYPPENETATLFTNILNGTPWTRAADQPTNGRVCLAWDITVTQTAAGNNGGVVVEGRVYSNEYRSMVSSNGNTTSPTFFILTRSGFLYQVDFMETDPFGFPLFSNSRGIVDASQMATYQSWNNADYIESLDPSSWTEGNNYLYDPQAEDMDLLWNNKVFFNTPDPNMPSEAIVTDIINGNNTHTTWLLNEVASQNVGENIFGFNGIVPQDGICDANLTMQVGVGGNFIYTSQVAGLAQLQLDLNNNGSFNDPEDRMIEAEAMLGEGNIIFWDGLNGLGDTIPENPNFQFNYDLTIRGGEVHIMMDDIENNLGGVSFTRLNGVESPDSEFFYDHTNVGGPVSGGGTPGNALPTTVPYVYSNNAGNENLLDFWAFVEANNFGSGTLVIAVVEDCMAPPVADNDGDGIPDVDDIDDDNDGISDAAEIAVAGNNGDTDGDGVPDIFDLDSDNDGISDLVEAGHGLADTNGDGVIDGPPADFGDNGLHNSLETSDELTAVINYVPADTDNDGVPDHVDLDSDNDGLLDVVEADFGDSDTNNDGRIDDGAGNPPTVDENGLPPVIDPDSTGVGIPFPPDTDGDGVPDWHDLDSDNDGIHDVTENINPDPDSDGIIGNGTPTVDENGIVITDNDGTTVTYNPVVVNTDNDGPPDFRDLDSDGDGLLDVEEADLPDGDNDGILGVGVPPVDINGVPSAPDEDGNTITSTSNPPDTDGDGSPDFQDIDAECDETNTPVLTAISGGGGFCAGDSTTIIISGVDNENVVGPIDFTWTGPNGFTQAGQVDTILTNFEISLPNLTPVNSGTYTLTVTTSEGCISEPVGITVTVTQRPNATFISNADTVCLGENVTLTAVDLGADITYEWFRDQVSLGTSTVPSFSLGTAIDTLSGGYSVIATQNGCTGSPSATFNLFVSDVSVTPSNLIVDNPILCIGENFVIRANEAIGGATYQWFFMGEPFATTFQPMTVVQGVNLANSGFYSVETTQIGCNSVLSDSVEIVVIDNIAITLESDNTDLCEGDSFTLTAQADAPNLIFNWLLNDSIINSSTDTFLTINNATVANSGTYTVVPEDADCESNVSNAVVINVSETPAAPEIATPNNSLCEGDSLIITATDLGENVTYSWFLNDSLIATTNVPIFESGTTNASAGTYSVTPAVGICEGPSSNTLQISIGDTTAAPTLTVNDMNLCSSEALVLSASGAGGEVSYEWFIDSTSLGTTDEPTFSIDMPASGSYTVIVSGGDCGGGTSNAIIVTVLETPDAAEISVSDNDLCEGDSLIITATDLGENIVYTWFQDGDTVAITNTPIFETVTTTASGGSYSVIPTLGECEGPSSNILQITVGDTIASPTLTVSDTVLCNIEALVLTATGVDGDATYEWFIDSTSLGTSDEPTLNVATPTSGSYTVMVTSGDCGSGTSNAIVVTALETPSMAEISTTNNSLCEGDTLSIIATDLGEGVAYSWFQNGTLIAETNEPTLDIESITIDAAGTYTMTPSIGECEGPTSNNIQISVGESEATPILDTDSNILCSGETLVLNVSGVGGDVTYEWFVDTISLGTSTDPTFSVENANSGAYTVVATGAECGGGTSDILFVIVEETPVTGPIEIANPNACLGEAISITTTDLGAGATYTWFLNGDSIATTDVPVYEVEATEAAAGTYTLSTAFGDCEGELSNGLEITVSETAAIPTITIDVDGICPGETVVLSATGVEGDVTYEWFVDGASLGTTDEPTLIIEEAIAGNYTVMASNNGCSEGMSDPVTLTVNPIPDDVASIVTVADVECGVTSIMIEAVAPINSIGTWTSTDPNVVFDDPTSPITTITGFGSAVTIVWTLTDPICGEFSSDLTTLNIDSGEAVAMDDSYVVPFNMTLSGENVGVNDEAGENPSYTIITGPINGTATIDATTGNIEYTPNQNYFGNDQLEYEICNTECPNGVCDRAIVNISVEDDPDCFIPDVITPNSDGLNDVLMIPCAATNTIGLKIFNRWGDLVFESDNYNNDWEGTHNGDPLPPGPYYYLLTEPNANEDRTGCVSIYR